MTTEPAPKPVSKRSRPWVRRVRNSALGIVIGLAVAYVGEDFLFRFRIPKSRDPFSSVTVYRYYALHKSRDKTNLWPVDAQDVTCIRMAFPHAGYTPCWYLNLNAEQVIDYE